MRNRILKYGKFPAAGKFFEFPLPVDDLGGKNGDTGTDSNWDQKIIKDSGSKYKAFKIFLGTLVKQWFK